MVLDERGDGGLSVEHLASELRLGQSTHPKCVIWGYECVTSVFTVLIVSYAQVHFVSSGSSSSKKKGEKGVVERKRSGREEKEW